jgi:hypothetical protein
MTMRNTTTNVSSNMREVREQKIIEARKRFFKDIIITSIKFKMLITMQLQLMIYSEYVYFASLLLHLQL